jgi:hypothetical protein
VNVAARREGRVAVEACACRNESIMLVHAVRYFPSAVRFPPFFLSDGETSLSLLIYRYVGP